MFSIARLPCFMTSCFTNLSVAILTCFLASECVDVVCLSAEHLAGCQGLNGCNADSSVVLYGSQLRAGMVVLLLKTHVPCRVQLCMYIGLTSVCAAAELLRCLQAAVEEEDEMDALLSA